MKKTITYCSFAVTSLIVVLAFVSATTYLQLGIAILLYIPLVYFAFKCQPRRARRMPVTAVKPSVHEAAETGTVNPQKEGWGIADIDKRTFLKLIGGAGLAIFLYSIFSRKAEGLFLGKGVGSGAVSLQNIEGKKIDPAQNQPTDGYRISEIDDNVVTFYGFTNKDGSWFIMKEDTDKGSFRYVRGDNNFPGSWGNREHLAYDYYSNVF